MRKISILALFCALAFASIGQLSMVDGNVEIIRDGKVKIAKLNDELEKLDIIKTDKNSKAKITFNDNTIVTIGKESIVNVEDYVLEDKNVKFEASVIKGAFHAISGKIGKINPDKFRLKTKSASIGIRGTEFLGDINQVACLKGKILVFSNGEERAVEAGNIVKTSLNQVPSQVAPLDSATLDSILGDMGVSGDDIGLSSSDIANISKISQTNTKTSSDSKEDDFLNQQNQSTQSSQEKNPTQANSNQSQDSQNSWGYWNSEDMQSMALAIQDSKTQQNNMKSLEKLAEQSAGNQNSSTSNTTTNPPVIPSAQTSAIDNYVNGIKNNSITTDLRFVGQFTNITGFEPNDNFLGMNFKFGNGDIRLVGGYYRLELEETATGRIFKANNNFPEQNIVKKIINGSSFDIQMNDSAKFKGSFIGTGSDIESIAGKASFNTLNQINNITKRIDADFEAVKR